MLMRRLLALFLLSAICSNPAVAQSAPSPEGGAGVVDAFKLFDRVGEEVWRGWSAAASQLLLVGDSLEYFLKVPRTGTVDWTRRRILPPTFQATVPAVSGVPTIVIGTVT